MSMRSSGDVSLIPACRHCLTAASQPTREKMKVIAGNIFSRCSFSIISARDSRSLGSLYLPRRCLLIADLRIASRSRCKISGLIWPGFSKRSNMRLPIKTCWYKGIGLISLTITWVLPRTSPSHSPNSSALDTVAESEITCTLSIRWISTSSHTAPRNLSAK